MPTKEEKSQSISQRGNIKCKLLRKLVANARNIISYEVGVPVGVWKMSRLITWLEDSDVYLNSPVFEEYSKAARTIPSGKERLECNREALRRNDIDLNRINLNFHDRIIDAYYEIISTYGDAIDK